MSLATESPHDRQVEGGWAIRDGLEDGEVLVVDGLLRIHPGAKVTPVPAGGRTDRSARTEAAAPAGGASVRAK